MIRASLVGGLALTVAAPPAHAAGLIRDAETENLLRSYAKPILSAAGLGSQGVKIHIVNDRNSVSYTHLTLPTILLV